MFFPDSRWNWRQTFIAACAGMLACIAMTAPATAQVTQSQIDMFRNLPAEQQQAILNSLGSGSLGNGTSGALDPTMQAPLTNPPTTAPRMDAAGTGTAIATGIDGVPLPPRIEGNATLILGVELPPVAEGQAVNEVSQAILEDRRTRILAANPYELDDSGRLTLPFLPPIALKGLTAEDAVRRLNSDPRLAGLKFNVNLLQLEPIGTQSLKPFGYDLFTQVPTTFAPASDIPVAANYVVGPGDTFIIDLFGKTSGHHSLVVSREGRLQLPNIGPMQVSGLTFEQASQQIQQRINEQMSGVQSAVTMGALRSIQIFVTGDVTRPGVYTISGLSSVTNALFATGGVSNIGSLRNIELKRNGASVGTFDLYDLILRGDSSGDRRLLPGDVIFVPPVGLTAGIAGQVLRPAIYELKSSQTLGELLTLSGGLAPDAAAREARLERIDPQGRRTVLDMDLTTAAAKSMKLRAGDVLTIPKVLDEPLGTVSLQGHVQRSGISAYRSGMHLTDLIGSLDALKLNADQRYVLIRRESLPDRRIEVLSADLTAAFAQRHGAADPELQSRDRVLVFSMQRDRGTDLAQLLNEMKLQARDNRALPTANISGNVRAPGEYPLQPGMKISDLLRAGGGLNDDAYASAAELARYEVLEGEKRRSEVIKIELASLTQNSAADIELKPYDTLTIQRTPDWFDQGSIVLRGEVRFPGVYPLRKGETLKSVIERAGGLTDEAYPEGSVFTRAEIQQQQQQQIDQLTARMQSDLSVLALQTAQTTSTQNQNSNTLAIGQSLLTQLRGSKATGRLVIDLPHIMEARAGSGDDLIIQSGDSLIVPKIKQYVSVIGEVQNSTAHVWRKELDRNHYIQLSGGTSRNVDEKRIYVVRANGAVVPQGSRWFSGNVEIKPGDTVVAPLDAGRLRPLPLWGAVTQIIYNLAIAAAAVNSF